MCLHFPKDWRKRYKSESDYFHCQQTQLFDRFVLERFCWSCKKGFLHPNQCFKGKHAAAPFDQCSTIFVPAKLGVSFDFVENDESGEE